MKPFTYKEMLMLDRMKAASVWTPAASMPCSMCAPPTWEANKGVTTLWLKDLSKPAVPEVKLSISEGAAPVERHGARTARRSLPFLAWRRRNLTTVEDRRGRSNRHTSDAVCHWILDPYRMRPMVKGLVFSLAVSRNARSSEIACTVKKNEARKADKSTGDLYDKLFIRHWDTWADGTRNHLFFLPLER
ncbi:MAG: hypothetical protein IPL86_11730 [Flavobacteriales bacterium]|nr:hypothetical protein [Flavobacteriales bacterium]